MRNFRFQFKDNRMWSTQKEGCLNLEAESLEDAIKLCGVDREGIEYKLVFDIKKENFEKRKSIDKFLDGMDVKDAPRIARKFNSFAQNVEFDLKKGIICLAPSYEDYRVALKALAKEALAEEVSDEDLAEIFWDAKKEDYPNYKFVDWDEIYQEIVEHSEEVEYSTNKASIETDSITVGWNPYTESMEEGEFSYVGNYKELEEMWKEQIVEALRDAVKDASFVGGITKEEFFEDTYDLVETYKDRYPMPTEEEILTEGECGYNREDD